MRTLLLTVGICTALVRVAAAQPSDTAAAPPRQTSWSVDASAAVGSSDTSRARTEAALTGALSQQGGYGQSILLPTVDSDADLRLSAGGDADGLSLSHGTRARLIQLSAPGSHDMLLPFDVRYQLDRNVRPELSSRLGLLRRTYSRAGYGWTVAAGELYGWRALEMGMDVARMSQDTGDGVVHHTEYDFALTFFTYTRHRDDGSPELQLDLIAASGPAVAVNDGPDASVGRIDFVAARNVPLVAGLYADASVGVTGTGSFSTSTSVNGHVVSSTTVMTEDLPLMSTPAASARLFGSFGGVTVSVGAARTLSLTSDVHLVLENRATGELSFAGRHNQLALTGFAAQTELWTDKTTSQRSVTGGGAAAWTRDVGHELSLTGRVELARSFYAVLDGDPTPRPETAARASLVMTKHFAGASL